MKTMIRPFLLIVVAILMAGQVSAQEANVTCDDQQELPDGTILYFTHVGDNGFCHYSDQPSLAKGEAARYDFSLSHNGADEIGEEAVFTVAEINAINVADLLWECEFFVPETSTAGFTCTHSGIGSFIERADLDAEGEHLFVATGTDPNNTDGTSLTKGVGFGAQVPPENNPPTVNSFTEEMTAGDNVCIDVFSRGNATDLDGDDLSLIVQQESANITLLSDDGESEVNRSELDDDETLCWTVPEGTSGSEAIDFQVTDGIAFSDIATITIIVNPSKVFVLDITDFTLSKVQVSQGELIDISYTAVNAERVEGSGGPSNWDSFEATADPDTTVSNTVTNIGPFNQVGTFTLSITGFRDDDDVTKTAQIQVVSSTQVLTVDASAVQTTVRLPSMAQLKCSLSYENIDEEDITQSWSQFSGPTSASFSSTSVLNPTVSSSTAGTFGFRCSASTSEASDSDDVQVTFLPETSTNQPPLCGLISWDETAVAGERWDGNTFEPSDLENDRAKLVILEAPNGVKVEPFPPSSNGRESSFVSPGSILTMFWDNPIAGTHTIRYQCEDENGAASSPQVVQINVNPPPPPPDSCSDLTGREPQAGEVFSRVRIGLKLNPVEGAMDYHFQVSEMVFNEETGRNDKEVFIFSEFSKDPYADFIPPKNYLGDVYWRVQVLTDTWCISDRIKFTIVSGTDTEDETVFEFALENNYPNPFNPQTTIPFEVAQSGHVELTVVNMLGRTVGRIVSGSLAPGRYEKSWDAGNLPSGIYLYRLETPEGIKSKTMSLVK